MSMTVSRETLRKSYSQVAELMRAADELISKMGRTKTALSQTDADVQYEEILQQQGMKMICDETSCVIVPLAAASNTVHGPTGSPANHPYLHPPASVLRSRDLVYQGSFMSSQAMAWSKCMFLIRVCNVLLRSEAWLGVCQVIL